MSLNKFQDSIIDTSIYQSLIEYLSINDRINFLYINKYTYNKIKVYLIKNIKNRTYNIIYKAMLKYINILKCVDYDTIYGLMDENKITRKLIALHYFKYYPKNHIPYLYNMGDGLKKKIIDRYKIKITNTPTRFDLYYLFKNIPLNYILFIGW